MIPDNLNINSLNTISLNEVVKLDTFGYKMHAFNPYHDCNSSYTCSKQENGKWINDYIRNDGLDEHYIVFDSDSELINYFNRYIDNEYGCVLITHNYHLYRLVE